MDKKTKIEVAIADTNLHITKVKEEIILKNHELKILEKQLNMLEIIKDDDKYE